VAILFAGMLLLASGVLILQAADAGDLASMVTNAARIIKDISISPVEAQVYRRINYVVGACLLLVVSCSRNHPFHLTVFQYISTLLTTPIGL
jgi:hypothetical protein